MLDSPGILQDIKGYLAQCLRQVPSAWKSGNVIVTATLAGIQIVAVYLGWQLAAVPVPIFWTGVAAVAIVEVLAIFPFKVWRENQTRIKTLEEAARPKLRFTRLTATELHPRRYSIELRNEGAEPFTNCLVKIDRIDITDGKAVPMTWPRVLRTDGQVAGERYGSFILRPGETKSIVVVYQAPTASKCIALDDEKGQVWLTEVRRCILYLAAYSSAPPATAAVEVWSEHRENDRIVARLLKDQ